MREIIILGSGPGYDTVPTDKETWIVGKMLMINKPPKRVDMLFSMDDIDFLLAIRRGMFTKQEYINAVNERKVPFYSSVAVPEIAMSREYPMKTVVAKLRVPYFTNTVCYMIAYAIFQGVTRIDMYGVSQMGAHEYITEKGGVEFWLGMAMGMGINVNIMTISLVCRSTTEYPYGYVNTLKELNDKGKL